MATDFFNLVLEPSQADKRPNIPQPFVYCLRPMAMLSFIDIDLTAGAPVHWPPVPVAGGPLDDQVHPRLPHLPGHGKWHL